MHIIKWKKPIWKGYILYDASYVTFWKRSNYGMMNRMSTEEFSVSETVLCDTIKKDRWHYAFVKTHRMYNTKSEP